MANRTRPPWRDKWKGITGGGTCEVMGATRPVEAGTYQNCARIRGAMKMPG